MSIPEEPEPAPHPELPEPEYLGDGVYASFDGYQFWLGRDHHLNREIALEPAVMRALLDYRRRVYEHYGRGVPE